ncbi:MAG: ECF-type sigma factor [Planctomycetota bacterium]|jgi:RNA polymerase sigma factor (TIGR02999 family)
MPDPDVGTVTAHLEALADGDGAAQGRLWACVYEELRQIAAALMTHERSDHTLQPTALVNEAYARLLGGARLGPRDRAYFFAAAAQAMRRILIEHGRRRTPDAEPRIVLDALTAGTRTDDSEQLAALDAGLDALHRHDARAADVVMLRFFAGLSVEETADVAGVSPRTVKRAWAYGRAWLYRWITSTPTNGAGPAR